MNKLNNLSVVILCPTSDIEHVKRLKLPYTVTDYIDEKNLNQNNTIICRWGAGWEPNNTCEKEFKNHITNYQDIALNCDKHKASKKLGEVVNIPKLYENRVKRNKLVVIRPFKHTQGENFRVERGPIKIPFGFYAKDFIKSKKEIRIWVCNNRTITAKRVTQSQKRLSEKFHCRSKWGYSHWKKTPKYLEKQALKAAKHLGFKYGAFDVVFNQINKKWYFLEFNTACAIDDAKIISFFSRGMKSIINKKIKQVKKDLKKNPPLEARFKIVSFNASPNVLKELNEKKTAIKPLNIVSIPNKNNILVASIPAQPKKYGFFSRLFGGTISQASPSVS